MDNNFDFSVPTLGSPHIPSPIHLSERAGDLTTDYVTDEKHILYDIVALDGETKSCSHKTTLQLAGPRKTIYFDPAKVRAAIVTCGGLCPGLNNVIRAIVMSLYYHYGVKRISGIKYGFRGFLPEYKLPVIDLTPALVEDIHKFGGSFLGSSRGEGNRTTEIVDAIEQMNLSMLFVIGGDGSQHGALAIADETEKRNMKLAIVGVPKTIDNDLSFIERSFGFETAVSCAVNALASAHVEAHDAVNGIGIVKVMGRDSGFIAAHTALAMNDVNVVLIPEVPFALDGENGLLHQLEKRLQSRNHAVILAAEGAGQELLNLEGGTDASGNKKLGDIGAFLRDKISDHFKALDIETNIKYIDPSYMIRSAPANPGDAVYCARLGANAVHAAMAGKTKILIGLVNNYYVHLPIALAITRRNKIDPESALWGDVIQATGQPAIMR